MIIPSKKSKDPLVLKAIEICEKRNKDFKDLYQKSYDEKLFQVVKGENTEYDDWVQNSICLDIVLKNT